MGTDSTCSICGEIHDNPVQFVQPVPYKVAKSFTDNALLIQLSLPVCPNIATNALMAGQVRLILAAGEEMLYELTVDDYLATPESRQLAVVGHGLMLRRSLRRSGKP
jgi:hypothetical protein